MKLVLLTVVNLFYSKIILLRKHILLGNWKNSNACKNIKKFSLRLNLTVIFKIEMFSLQRSLKTLYDIFFSTISFGTLRLDFRIQRNIQYSRYKSKEKIVEQVSGNHCEGEILIFEMTVDLVPRQEIF